MELQYIRQRVRRKLDDMSYDSVAIDEAINDFQDELFNNYRLRIAEVSDTLNVSADETEVIIPDDFDTMLYLGLIDGATVLPLTKLFVEYNYFMQNHSNYLIATSARPWYWTHFGNNIRLAAPSNGDYEMSLDYLRKPVRMESDGDVSEIPANYEEMMVLGALARIMEMNEDYAEGGQERDKLQRLVTGFVKREGRGGFKAGPGIIQSNRGRRRWTTEDF